MDALTPARPALRPSSGMNTGSCTRRSPWSTPSTFRPFRLQPPAPAPPCQGTLPFGRSNQERFPTGLLPTGTRGFATALQARHASPAESSFLAYGLAVHPRLLSTPCRHDAVAGDYKLRLLGADFHPSSRVRYIRRTVRQLAAAFLLPPACWRLLGGTGILPVNTAWPGRPWHDAREQARGEESGSKLPHSKAARSALPVPG